MIVGAIVLYDASPIPTIARNDINVPYDGIIEPNIVVPLHKATPNIIIHRREYLSPKYPNIGAQIIYDMTNAVCNKPLSISVI